MTLKQLVGQLRSEHQPTKRSEASKALTAMGAELTLEVDWLLPELEQILKSDSGFGYAINPYASIGRDNPSVRQRVIDLARPRPPIWKTYTDFPDSKFDIALCHRGDAINAMIYFVDSCDECIPVLIDALRSFQEFDPDEMRGGPGSRVAGVLKQFGPKAINAAEALANFAIANRLDSPLDVMKALAAIDPSTYEMAATLVYEG